MVWASPALVGLVVVWEVQGSGSGRLGSSGTPFAVEEAVEGNAALALDRRPTLRVGYAANRSGGGLRVLLRSHLNPTENSVDVPVVSVQYYLTKET